MKRMINREYGLLLHPVSLSSDFSIGDFGQEAFRFIDIMKSEDIRYWQILPVTYTGFDNSPYNSLSAFAGNPVMISISEAIDYFSSYTCLMGTKEIYSRELKNWRKTRRIDYWKSFSVKSKILKELYNAVKHYIIKNKDYISFKDDNAYWLNNFAAYKILKDFNNGKSWNEWKKKDRVFSDILVEDTLNDNNDKFEFIVFKQYLFFRQWKSVKEYAAKSNIKIIGDIPIYVAMDSADVWSNQSLFDLSSDFKPVSVAGVPPDYFSKTGQLWGNPLYRWESNNEAVFDWWNKRLSHLALLIDEVRIDHFIGLINYWAIPYGSKNAKKGLWKKGPGNKFIKEVLENVPEKVLAENLGILTNEVENIRKENKIPGMKVLQFHYEDSLCNMDNEDYLYTGTHDNDTLKGWLKSLLHSKNEQFIRWCMQNNLKSSDFDSVYRKMLDLAVCSSSNTIIFPVQDALGLGSYGRMNTPGTKNGNWIWKMSATALSSNKISRFMSLIRSLENHSG